MVKQIQSRARMMQDPYSVLQVEPGADFEAVKTAYRALAKDAHPDAPGGDVDRFLELRQAYDVLGRIARRRQKRWEDLRRQRPDYRAKAKARAERRAGAGSTPPVPEDGHSERTSEPAAPTATERAKRPARYRLRISLEEASLGGRRRTPVKDGRVLAFRIPKGAESGQIIHLPGQGPRGADGARRDAQVEILVRPHAEFERDGAEISSTLTVPLWKALIGGSLSARTLHGEARLFVPKRLKNGTVIRIRGAGVAGEGAHAFRLTIGRPRWLTALMKPVRFGPRVRRRARPARQRTAEPQRGGAAASPAM
ncbi:MAG: DnaJ C-terminal domain-containing protein [Pseudomonadota bacterium]